MSALLLPRCAPDKTRLAVTSALMALPELTRLLDAPGLLAAVCLNAANVEDPTERHERLRRAASAPHKELLAHFGLPGLPLTRRLTGAALEERCLRTLARLSKDGYAVRVLRHARYVSPELIFSLDEPQVRRCATGGFFGELGAARAERRPTAGQIFELACFLSAYKPGLRLESLDHYRQVRRRFRELLRNDSAGRRLQPVFPAPPWRGEPGYATPLTTWRELIEESVLMRNCVGTHRPFVHQVQAGSAYFYRVEPAWGLPRATLQVVRDGSHWRIGEARAKFNDPLRRCELLGLAVWVAEQQGIADEAECLPELEELDY